jgi:hypothetical protein
VTKILLILHVLAAIIAIGPVTMARGTPRGCPLPAQAHPRIQARTTRVRDRVAFRRRGSCGENPLDYVYRASWGRSRQPITSRSSRSHGLLLERKVPTCMFRSFCSTGSTRST